MTETNGENLKKEIDTSGNEKIDIQEMEEFFKSEENIKKLGEVMKSDISSELIEEMENVLKNLCSEIIKKQNVNDISPNQYKILSFYMACGKENQNEQTYKKVGVFIGKLYKNYQKELKKYSEGKGEKPSNVIAQFFEEELQQQINKISQLAEKRLKEMEDEMNPLIQQQRKEEERQNKLLERWENDKRDIENLLQKDGELSEEDKQRLSYFRDFYYNEGHILYKNTGVNTEISNLLTYELGGKGLSFGIVGYDKIANQIDNKLNSGLFNFIDKIINNGELSKDIKGLKKINEWIMKFGRNNPEKYEQLNGMISNEIINISKKTFENEDSDRLTESQVGTFQLWTNINYGENLIIDGIRGNKPFGNGENQEITNLYIYREEICSRNSKKYDILKIPNLDNILKSLQSKDKEHKTFKEFMIFFLKIKQPGKYFEVQIGNENLENILKFIVSTEKYKNVSIDDYLNLYFNGDLTDNEKSQKIALKEQLSQYETIDGYFKDKAKKLIKLCLEKSNKIVEIDNELHLQNKIKEFYELFWDLKGDKNKKEKLEKLGKEILNNPRLQKEQRKEILIMLGGTFSEIETKRNEISVRKGFQRICRGGHFSDLAPNTIKYTQGCNIKVGYLKNIIDTDRYFPKGQEPLNLTIYLDGTPLAIGGPLQIGKKFKHNGYDIHIDKNKDLIIKKLGGSGSELRDTFGDKIYNEYQIAQNELNEKSKRHEEISDIQAQVESDNGIKIHSISQEEKKIINDETGYTEKYKKYKSACEGLRYAQTQYAKYPDAPKTPNYTEYHHLNIPGCDGQLVHITPSELIKIKTAINKHGNSICYNPKNKSNNKIHELKLSDLNISEKDKNGDLHLYEINNNGNQGKEIKKISATDLSEIGHTNNLVMKSIQIAPGLKDALDKASKLSKDFEYIEGTYKKFDQAKLTNEDAKNIMIKADSIIKFLNELCNHHNDFVQLKKGLEQRHSGKSNIDTESEKTIKLIISNLDYLINATVSGGEIKKYCESFLNEKKVHSNDDRTERTIWRFRNNGIKTIFAILGGVAAVCLVPVSGGGSLALLQMSMIMTAGGMVGGFTGQIANEQINNTFTKPIALENGETIQVRYDDPTSLELAIKGEISRKDFAIDTGINFALGTATTFGCMAAGQFVGRRITKACESGNISPKFELFLKKFNKNFKVENGDPMTDSMFKEIANKISQNPKSLISKFNESFFREFKDELGEEITESGFEEIGKGLRNNNPGLAVICSGLASLATAWHCLTPGGNMTKMYKENGISIGDLNFSGGNSTIEITLDYNGNRDAIIKYYTENGYKEVNGHLTMKNAENPEITNIIHLRETKVPIEVRSFASELSGYGINIDSETGKGYYQNISKIQDLELSGKANVTIDPETKKVTIISGETTLELEQDYFGGKSHKFDINTTQASKNIPNLTGKIQNMKEGDIKDLLDGKSEIKLEELSANELRLLMFKACNMGLDFHTIEKLGVAIEHSLLNNPEIEGNTKTELRNYVNYLCYITEINNININEDANRIEVALDDIQQQIDIKFGEDSITAKELSIETNKKKFELYKKNGDIKQAQDMVNLIREQNTKLLGNDTTNFRYRRGVIETDLLEIQLGGEGGKNALKRLNTNAQEVREKTETIGGRTDTETLISKVEAGILIGKSEGELQPYLDFLALTEHGAGINILGTVIQTINTTFDSDGAKGALEKYAENVTDAGEKSKDSHLMEAGEKANKISETYNKMKDDLDNDSNWIHYTEIQSRLENFVKNRTVSSISDVGNNFSHFTVLLNPGAAKNSPVMSIEIGKVDYETAYNTLKSEFQKEGIDIEGDIGDYNTFIGKFNKVVDNWIRTNFGTEKLQELNSPEHRALFDYIAAKFMESRRGSADASLTNLSQLLDIKGVQDCRLHAFTKQLFFDSWKTNKLNSLEKSKTGNPKIDAEINKQIKIIENTKMVFMDAEFSGNIDMNAKYVARTEDGHMEAGSQNNVIEEHTFNLLEMPVLDAEGNLQYENVLDDTGEPTGAKRIKRKVCFADSFYQGSIEGGVDTGKVYNLSYTGEDISGTIYGKKGEDVYMTTKVTDVNGKEIEIKVKPLTWSMKGRGDNITGSSIETRGPDARERSDLSELYTSNDIKADEIRYNRQAIQGRLNEKLDKLKSGEKVDLTNALKIENHEVAGWQANQLKRAFELYEKVPTDQKSKAEENLRKMIANTVTQNAIDFAGAKGDATEFLQTEGVFFDAMQIFNDVYKTKIEEATKQLDPKDPESVKRLQEAINEYQKIFDTDMKDFFKRFSDQLKRELKMEKEEGRNIDGYQVYDRNNFEHTAKRFKSDSNIYLNALKKYEELGMHKQAFELRQQIKTQYNELLSNSQEILGHFINSDSIKSELKGPLGREIYAKLISIQNRLKNGENINFNEEFGKDSDKIKNLLGIESWSKNTIEASIKKIQESGLADYYNIISLVHNSQIETMLTEDAVYGSKEKGYYLTQEDGYVRESYESYEQRMIQNKVFEEGLRKGEKNLGDIGQHLRGLIETNEVLDNTSKVQINNLISNMISKFGDMFPSNLEAYKFFKATTEVLISQTMESDTRSMGDHGINHISGNIAKLSNYLESEGSLKGDLKKWQFMGYITHIFHDKGYSALIAQGANHRKGTDLHPFTSKMYFNDVIKPLLGSTGINTELISQAIESHDGINLDFSSNENIFLSRVNISDNMALGLDKVPILWRHPKILNKITLLYEWSKSGMDLKEGISTIKENLDKDKELSINEKEALKSAISELNRRSFENIDFLSIHPTGDSEVLENGVRRINMYKATSFEIAAEICGINPDELNALIKEAKRTGDTSKLIELIKNDKFGNQIIKPLKDYQDKYILTNKDGKEYPKKKNKKGKYEYNRDVIAADLLIGKPIQIQNGVKAEANEDFVQSNGETIAEYSFKENEEIPDNLKDKNYENIENQTVEYIDGIMEAEARSQIESIGNVAKSIDGLINAVQKNKTDISPEIDEFKSNIGKIQTGGNLGADYLNAVFNIQNKLEEFYNNNLKDHGGDGQETYSNKTIEDELGRIKKDIEKLITYLL